jgi:hypothetical protein
MADRYITLNNGKNTMTEATVVSTGVAEAGDILALDSNGKIDESVLPIGVGPDVKIATVNEASGLSAGDYVNIFDNGGTPNVRLADNSNGRPAHGFVKASHADATQATIYFEGPNADLAGLTVGGRVYLGTAGGVIQTPLDPAINAGDIHQLLGTAVDTTEVNTDIEDCIQL